MRRIRTTKAVAKRVDAQYVRQPRLRRSVMIGLAVVLSVAALAWTGVQYKRNDQTLYSPGRLAHVHSMWENDCAKCHLSNGKGGFSEKVYDSACLTCHAGAIHHPQQATMVVRDAEHKAVRSSDCMQCHIEHRGTDMLLAKGDSACISCHDNLGPKTIGPVQCKPSVVRFTLASHPPFGRKLTEAKVWDFQPTALRDPTPILFSHADHMPGGSAHVPPLAGQSENCSVCHQLATSSTTGDSERPDRRYMLPVTYRQYCAGCHALKFVDGQDIYVPHESLSLLQPFFEQYAGQKNRALGELASLPEDKQKALLDTTVTRPGPPPLRKPIVVKVSKSPVEYATGKAEVLRTIANQLQSQTAQLPPSYKALADALNAADLSKDIPSEVDARAVEYYTAHKVDLCVKCHELSDNPAAVKRLDRDAGPPMAADIVDELRSSPAAAASKGHGAHAPASMPSSTGPLETLPTGITASPRRWFVNSTFDHDAHRSMSCLACHKNATTSDKMSVVMMPTINDCVNCHHEPNAEGMGAGAACQTCHVYHDRSQEERTGQVSIEKLIVRGPLTRPSGK